jgi:AraC-like DNA-binding protein
MSDTHRIGTLIELPDVLRTFGIDPEKIFSEVGLEPALFRDPDAGIPFTQLGRLMTACADASGCPHFGLVLGSRAELRHLGVVGVLMRHASTLGASIACQCVNQQRYVRGAVCYLMVQDDTAFWGYAVQGPAMRGLEIIYDAAVAVGVRLMRELIGTSAESVLMLRSAPPDLRPYQDLLGIVPRFDAEQTAIAFPAALLGHPVAGADPVKFRAAARAVQDYWTVRRPNVGDQLARILRAKVIFSVPTVREVAHEIGLPPRTLNRRLEEEGTSFRNVLGLARYSAAQQLLSGTNMTVAEIGTALGYSDLPAFSRAFQGWASMSPYAWRVKEQGTPSSLADASNQIAPTLEDL